MHDDDEILPNGLTREQALEYARPVPDRGARDMSYLDQPIVRRRNKGKRDDESEPQAQTDPAATPSSGRSFWRSFVRWFSDLLPR